jgi:hypothetical protein
MSKPDRRVARTHRQLQKALMELLANAVPPGMTSAYRHLGEAWARPHPVCLGRGGPLDLLANFLAGAQIAMLQWRLEKRRPHTPEQLARTFHRLQRAAIREAFGIGEAEAG